MKKIFCLIGLPGAGKSTWVNSHITDMSKTAVINMDTIRREVAGDPTDQTQNALVALLARQKFMIAVSHGVPNIYWDNTTTQRKYRKELIEIGKKGGYEVVAVYFKVPFEICVKRNMARDRVVPYDVLVRMRDQLTPPSDDEGWNSIIVIDE